MTVFKKLSHDLAALFSSARADIPFARDDANRLLPWIIGCIVALSALMLALANTLHTDIAGKHSDYRRTVTVQLPSDAAADTKRTAALLKSLDRMEGVTDAELLGKAEVKRRIAPWFSDAAMVDDLPLPTVIDITLAGDNETDITGTIAQLKEKVTGEYPAADFDAHEAWIGHLGSFARFIEITAGMMAALMLIAMAAIIVLSTRTAFRIHLRTVELLHRFGATDEYILRQFQANAAQVALKGSLPGIGAAAVIYALLLTTSLPYFSFSIVLVSLWLCLVPVTILIALVAARMSVRSILYALP